MKRSAWIPGLSGQERTMLPALALLLLLGRPAAADVPASAAVERLRVEGKACYRQQDYRCALAKFQEAFALIPSPEMLFNIASARDKLGQYALAVRQYQQYLKQTGIKAPPAAYLHIQRRLKLLLERVARLQLSLDPPAARAALDGEPLDLSSCQPQAPPAHPCEIVVEPGSHQLEAVADGFEPFSRELILKPGQVEALTIELTPLPVADTGSLVIRSTPSGARVWIDGEVYARNTPVEIDGLAPGQHDLQLATATLHYGAVVQIAPGQRTEVVAALRPVQIEVEVTSDPPGARVTLDGREVGTTPVVVHQLAAGQYRLSLARPGYRSADHLLQIEGASPLLVTVHKTLERRSSLSATPASQRLVRPLVGALLAPESAALDSAATVYADLAAAGSTAYTCGVEGRFSLYDRIQFSLDIPFLSHGLFTTLGDSEARTVFGDLQLLVKIKLAGDSEGAYVISVFGGGSLPTTSLELPSRRYTALRSGIAAAARYGIVTVGGDLTVHAELTEGDDWVLFSGTAYSGVQLARWLSAQLGVQVAPALKPTLDEPALGIFPAVNLSLSEAISLAAGVRIAATDAGRYLLCRGASRALLLLNAGYVF